LARQESQIISLHGPSAYLGPALVEVQINNYVPSFILQKDIELGERDTSFEILTPVAVIIHVFWEVMPCVAGLIPQRLQLQAQMLAS